MPITVQHQPAAAVLAKTAKAYGQEQRRRQDEQVAMQMMQMDQQAQMQQAQIDAQAERDQRMNAMQQERDAYQADIAEREATRKHAINLAAMDYEAGIQNDQTSGAWIAKAREEVDMSQLPPSMSSDIQKMYDSLAEISESNRWANPEEQRLARERLFPKLIGKLREAQAYQQKNQPDPMQKYMTNRVIDPDTGAIQVWDGRTWKSVENPQQEQAQEQATIQRKQAESEEKRVQDARQRAEDRYYKALERHDALMGKREDRIIKRAEDAIANAQKRADEGMGEAVPSWDKAYKAAAAKEGQMPQQPTMDQYMREDPVIQQHTQAIQGQQPQPSMWGPPQLMPNPEFAGDPGFNTEMPGGFPGDPGMTQPMPEGVQQEAAPGRERPQYKFSGGPDAVDPGWKPSEDPIEARKERSSAAINSVTAGQIPDWQTFVDALDIEAGDPLDTRKKGGNVRAQLHPIKQLYELFTSPPAVADDEKGLSPLDTEYGQSIVRRMSWEQRVALARMMRKAGLDALLVQKKG